MTKRDLAPYQEQNRHSILRLVAVLVLLSSCGRLSSVTEAFVPATTMGIMKHESNSDQSTKIQHFMASPPSSSSKESKENNQEIDPITKASWYAVEWFGKTFGGTMMASDNTVQEGPPRSIQETLQRLQADNERAYFLSGQVDADIYDPECIFKDPFVSFAGRDRFVTNLENLGSFITKYDVNVIQSQTHVKDNTVKTKFMVKLELNLPWKPILAWPWGVTYTINPQTFLIQEHEESWDIEPWEGVLQIFRKPTLKL